MIETIPAIGPDEIDQPGVEQHSGWETELGYTAPRGFVRLGYNTSKARLECPDWAAGGGRLVTPADTLTLSVGSNALEGALEYGYRGRHVFSREIQEDGFSPAGINPCKTRFPIEKAPSYTVHNLFLSWKPDKRTVFRVAIDNLTNRSYELEKGDVSGSPAPGRSVKLSLARSF